MVNIISNNFNQSSDEYSLKSGCPTFQFVSLLIQNPQTNKYLIVKKSDKYSNQREWDIPNNLTTTSIVELITQHNENNSKLTNTRLMQLFGLQNIDIKGILQIQHYDWGGIAAAIKVLFYCHYDKENFENSDFDRECQWVDLNEYDRIKSSDNGLKTDELNDWSHYLHSKNNKLNDCYHSLNTLTFANQTENLKWKSDATSENNNDDVKNNTDNDNDNDNDNDKDEDNDNKDEDSNNDKVETNITTNVTIHQGARYARARTPPTDDDEDDDDNSVDSANMTMQARDAPQMEGDDENNNNNNDINENGQEINNKAAQMKNKRDGDASIDKAMAERDWADLSDEDVNNALKGTSVDPNDEDNDNEENENENDKEKENDPRTVPKRSDYYLHDDR